MTAGERIRARRTELKLTQAQLTQALGLKNRQSVNRMELGHQAVSAEQAAKLAPLLKVSPAWLLFGAADES
ncbi:MAG TPA: helix-turn-helix domain-containing protein [Thauera aminoaromatica]|nr:helix-turn-helix domain-containing protein [Thauera aminoaromatica]